MKESRMLQVAVIGCGYFGTNHARIYEKLPNAQLMAVCDRNRAMADELAAVINSGRSDHHPGSVLLRKLHNPVRHRSVLRDGLLDQKGLSRLDHRPGRVIVKMLRHRHATRIQLSAKLS